MRTFAALLYCIVALYGPSAVAESFRIGVVLPLTGGAAASGETVRNSIELAASDFDPEGKVKFTFEDDQLSPKNTVAAVTKLISSDKVDGLIVFGSPTSLAVAGIAEEKHVPMIALSIVDRVVSGRSFVVKHWVSSKIENELVIAEVRKHAYQRVAVVATTNDAMLALRDHFVSSKPAEIILNVDLAKEETDFKTLVTRIVSLRPDAVYNLLWAPQPGIFALNLRQAGFKGDIFGVHNLEDPNVISGARGALEGAWLVTGDDSAGKRFLEKYQARFGKLPTAGGLNGFDSAKLMLEGLRSGDLNGYLHNVKNFAGAFGSYGASGFNDFTIRATTKVVRAGKIER